MDQAYSMVPMPKQFIVFGDTQFHQWSETERPDHWKTHVNVLCTAFKLAHKEHADIIFLGDLFESKRSVRSDVQALVYSTLVKAMRKYPCTFHFIAGNHDQYAGVCTQSALRLGPQYVVHDYDYPTYINEGLGIVALPYGASVDPALEYSVLCSHIDIRGAILGTGIKSESSSVDECLFDKGYERKLVLNGHYHVPHKIDMEVPIQCIGAPFQHNWNDARYADVPRGLWLLDMGGKSPTVTMAMPLDKYPRFYTSLNNKNYREEIDFIRAPIENAAGIVREESVVISRKDPTEFIPAYVCDRMEDEGRRKGLIRAGLALMKGEEE